MRKMSLMGDNIITINNKSDWDRVIEDSTADLKELLEELNEPSGFSSDIASDYDDVYDVFLKPPNYSDLDEPSMLGINEVEALSIPHYIHPLQEWNDWNDELERHIYNLNPLNWIDSNPFKIATTLPPSDDELKRHIQSLNPQNFIDNNLFAPMTALMPCKEKESEKDWNDQYAYLTKTNDEEELEDLSETSPDGIWDGVVQAGNKVTKGAAWVGSKIADGAEWLADKVVDGAAWVYNHPLEATQGVLDVAGLVPGVGEIADGVNAAIYAVNGDYINAGLSAGSMIPFIGIGSTAGKIGGKVANAAVDAAKIADAAGDAAKIANTAGDAAKIANAAGNAAKIADATGDATKKITKATIGTNFGKLGVLIANNGKQIVDWKNISTHGLERMTERGVTQAMVNSWVKTGKALEQSGGKILYIEKEGAAVIDKTGKLITAYTSKEFDKNMIQVVERLFGN